MVSNISSNYNTLDKNTATICAIPRLGQHFGCSYQEYFGSLAMSVPLFNEGYDNSKESAVPLRKFASGSESSESSSLIVQKVCTTLFLTQKVQYSVRAEDDDTVVTLQEESDSVDEESEEMVNVPEGAWKRFVWKAKRCCFPPKVHHPRYACSTPSS